MMKMKKIEDNPEINHRGSLNTIFCILQFLLLKPIHFTNVFYYFKVFFILSFVRS